MAKQYAKAQIQGEVFEVKPIGQYAKIRVSVNPGTKDKEGNWNEKLWFNVPVWNKGLVPYVLGLERGHEIFIEGGRIELNRFTTKDGQERSDWQIVLPPFDCDIDRQLGTFGEAEDKKAAPPKHPAEVPFDEDSEIPF